MKMPYLLIAYDVVKDRRRTRLARRIGAVLPRVQKSVFEGPTDGAGVDALALAITEEIDHATDTVRLVRLCATCCERVGVFGTAEIVLLEPEDVVLDGDGT